MQEPSLVARARDGDREAFAALVERYSGLVRSLAALYVGPGDAPDAAQEIWIAVFRKLWQLEDDARLVPWLRALVYHRCLNYRKRRAQSARHEVGLGPEEWARIAEGVADGEEGLAAVFELGELRRHVSGELDRLPADYGLILRLRYLRDLTYAEIARATGLPLSTVRWRIHYGKHLLRARLAALIRKRRPSHEHPQRPDRTPAQGNQAPGRRGIHDRESGGRGPNAGGHL